jgi:hypothetical protein
MQVKGHLQYALTLLRRHTEYRDVSTDQHDWIREERQAARRPRTDQIDVMRAAARRRPPIELLRAHAADALPEDLQTSVSEHLAASAMSRTLADRTR